MSGSINVHSVQIVLLLLLAMMVAIAGLARRLNISYPIVLVVAGLLVSFVPRVPRFPLSPDVVFLVFLPPLIFSAAWQASWREFRENLLSISMLAIGLVAFTVVVVAVFASRFIPELDWRAGFLLGAVVSPTDAIAASSIARRLGLPRRVVDILEGESLVNDATGLLALEFGVEMLRGGPVPTVGAGLLRLLWLFGGGMLVGIAIGALVSWVERWIDDGPVEIAITILVPYAVYLASEQVRASGVIAVLACGLYMARKSTSFFSAETRLQARAVWDALIFLLNGIVFLLIGLQLPYVMAGIRGYSHFALLRYGVIFSLLLIVARIAWMYPGAWVSQKIRGHFRRRVEAPAKAGEIFIVGWTGMRGVISLAAAGSLPFVMDGGKPFAARSMILFLTFCVILVTLVVQGLTLPAVIRLLGVGGQRVDCEEGETRKIILQAAIDRLRAPVEGGDDLQHAYEDLLHEYEHRLEALRGCDDPQSQEHEEPAIRRAAAVALQVEREALIDLRDHDRISEETLRLLQHELDLAESRLSSIRSSSATA